MNRQDVVSQNKKCHDEGKKVAVCFCSHVPQEVLEAAGICVVRLPIVEGFADVFPASLPVNACPTVRSCCAMCEDGMLDDVDVIITESSCDGKKKMYELIPHQDKLYYYQVVQGVDREYSRKLINSEIHYLIKMINDRFGVELADEDIKRGAEIMNEERESVAKFMQLQKGEAPITTGYAIYQELEKNRAIFDRKERIAANHQSFEKLKNNPAEGTKGKPRILVTGCPLSTIYDKVLSAVEDNGGIVVYLDNCEVLKSGNRRVDVQAENIIDALTECYLNSTCAIMAPNDHRFEHLKETIDEFKVDGVIDVSLQTCHTYSVERFKIQRFMEELGVPCLSVETSDTDADAGQLATRVTAFMEMI